MGSLPEYLSPAATLLAVVLAYVFGRRQTEHERLYTRRAEVIAALFERFEDMDQRLHSLVSVFDEAGGPDKKEKARLAAESFNDLQRYYRSNSIWLSRGTSSRFNDFLQRYRATINDFVIKVVTNEDRHRALVEEWDAIWQRFQKESPEIRDTLETEFRAALGDRRAKMALLKRWLLRSGSSQKAISEK